MSMYDGLRRQHQFSNAEVNRHELGPKNNCYQVIFRYRLRWMGSVTQLPIQRLLCRALCMHDGQPITEKRQEKPKSLNGDNEHFPSLTSKDDQHRRWG